MLESRSVYVGKLRRAFLLRAHPDRFRNHSPKIRRQQANLLQALSERMNAQDFQEYTSNCMPSATPRFPASKALIPYVLEKRDGSLLTQNLQLVDSVENILNNLTKALKMSGAASLPSLPSPPPKRKDAFTGPHEMFWAPNAGKDVNIDHQFDINTIQGRNFASFLQNINTEQIEERRTSRMDASAAALVARRLYSFQAIDGISLGWSSASFAKLLKSLIQLHDEHSSRFHVESFYPLRLVFSPDDHSSSLDVYSGNLKLRPAATQLQWLKALREVTEPRLEELYENRLLLHNRTSLVQNTLGVRINKGYSCSSEEYHVFLGRISEQLSSLSTDQDSTALEQERIRVVVESPAACRRGRVTNEGTIRVNSNMTELDLITAISRLSLSARERLKLENEHQERCKDAIAQIQWALGLQKVYRIGVVKHVEFLSALSRMVDQNEKLRGWVSGYSLGIASTGQFCHLADDGSLVIPHDWK